MDCNKEEAIKAKEMAEEKMQSKDFKGAQRIALKAQQLYPNLENITQILTVCQVHCSAEVKINGEMDWYGILQIQPTADEPSIKKQYRKLALVLHPDKNQFAGAEAAFKFIGEAQMTLLDPAKRHLYDIKRNAKVKLKAIPRQPAQQARTSKANFSSVNFNGLNQQQHSSFAATQTFWTMCPSCNVRYQYYRSTLYRTLQCQNCSKPFLAYDLANAVPSRVNPGHHWANLGVPSQQNPHPQTYSVNHQSQHGSVSSGTGFHGDTSRVPMTNSDQRGGQDNRSTDAKVNLKGTSANEAKFTNADSAKVDQSKRAAKSSNANAGQKRGRKVVTDSSDSGSSDAEDVPFEMKFESTEAPRRSSRRKDNVIYNEDGSENDDDFANPPSKRSRNNMTGMANDTEKHILHEEKLPNGTKKFKEEIQEDTSMKDKLGQGRSDTSSDLEDLADQQQTFNYPDPEFFDFENLRNATEFAVDQIWAIYDNVDGMPRFYARIRKIEGPGFSLRFTWLEHNPISEVEMEWSDEELPVACGNYRLGKSESTEDRLMFSHLIACDKGKKKNSYDVYPRTGQVWALFKNWNVNWSSDADSHRLYEYEVVEIISDFKEGSGISVIPLVKVVGFVSLFIRAKESSFIIPPNEMLKFSHNVPFYKLTGTEREGLPHGCVELDSASLPINFSEVFPSVSLDAFVGSADVATDKEPGLPRKEKDCHTSQNLHPSGAKVDLETNQTSDNNCPGVQKRMPEQTHQFEIHANKKHNQNNDNNTEGSNEKDAVDIDSLSPEPASPVTFEFPETEFHNFDDAKSIEKFEQGQIWALYSDTDQYPKYYGYVKKVDIDRCEVHVKWLESCSQQEEEKRWSKEGIPLGCGIFKVDRQGVVHDNTDTFSHLVAAEAIDKTLYKILPRVHEIWAVYKNWRAGWSFLDFENCEYDVVEISENSCSGFKVNILTKVDGYKAVFSREREGIAACTMVIPASEYIRFSHQIPSFLLTNEREGKLMGCWELDTASVPQILLF